MSRSPLHHPAVRSGHHQTGDPAGAAKAVTGGRTGRLGVVEEVVQIEKAALFDRPQELVEFVIEVGRDLLVIGFQMLAGQ
jgi:hypothetical protein